jgi:hypothetical protein
MRQRLQDVKPRQVQPRPKHGRHHRQGYRRTPTPMTMRSRTEVETLFDGFELVKPGVMRL